MQLTRAADYAVRASVHLAALPPGSRATLEDLAEAAEVPGQFLAKVLRQLVRAGLLGSYRGGSGGFELARPAAEITLLEVIEAIEGPLALNLCLMNGAPCHRHVWCGVHLVWKEAQTAMIEVLRKASLLSLAKSSQSRRELLETETAAPGVVTPAWSLPG